jgi:AcrR family transcriptional regulator
MSAASQPEPRRGRPRSEKAREAILDAAGDLLLGHGLSEVSMDEVAARAGVSKATIYRWWRTKEALALDTLYHEWDTARPLTPDNTGALRGDLLSFLGPWVRRARSRPFGRIVAELMRSRWRCATGCSTSRPGAPSRGHRPAEVLPLEVLVPLR